MVCNNEKWKALEIMNLLRSLSPERYWRSLALACLCLATGCATSPRSGQSKKPIFYPPAPEEPRLQFLTSYSGGGDLEGGQSKFVAFVAGKPPPKNPLLKPYGVAIHAGQLYVCDMGAGAVQILDLEKQIMRPFVPKGGGRLRLPLNLAIDADGTHYIVDANRNQVLIYANDGTYIAAIGQNEPVKIATPATTSAEARRAKNEALEMRPTDVAVTADRI